MKRILWITIICLCLVATIFSQSGYKAARAESTGLGGTVDSTPVPANVIGGETEGGNTQGQASGLAVLDEDDGNDSANKTVTPPQELTQSTTTSKPKTTQSKSSNAKNAQVYEDALRMLETGSLFDAADAFKKLGKYEESKQYAAYVNARILAAQSDMEGAYKAFSELGDFLNSRENADSIKEMMLVPFCVAFSEAAYGSDELLYGLMDMSGKQITRAEWRFIEGLACNFEYSGYSPKAGGLSHEHDYGNMAPENHITAYLVYDGEMEHNGTGYPLPKEGGVGYGLIDAAGREIVRAQYGKLLWLKYGMVAFTEANGEGVALFDLTDGNIPHNPIGVWTSALISGNALAVEQDGVAHYIRRDGSVISGPFDEVTVISEMGCVRIGEKWGYVDASGEMVIQPVYEDAKSFVDGLAPVKMNGSYFFIDVTENRITDGEYEDLEPFADGLAAAKQDGKWGFVDLEGKWIVKPQYDSVYDFNNLTHTAGVCLNGKWGMIDKKGKVVIKLTYDSFGTYTTERSLMLTKDGLRGEVNHKGKTAIKSDYRNMSLPTNHVRLALGKNGQFSMLNNSGKKLMTYNPKYQYASRYRIYLNYPSGVLSSYLYFAESGGYAAVYYNAKGKLITPVPDASLPSGKAQ